jgi:hypothetical protein
MIMRVPKVYCLLLVFSMLTLAALACGSFAPPESCVDTGTADEEAFNSQFTSMLVVDAATGEPGEPHPEGGLSFSSEDQLAVAIESLGEVEVRFCVTQRKGGGQIVYDETHTVQEGETTVTLTAFDSDPYVIRVIVNDTLVKNLPFTIE